MSKFLSKIEADGMAVVLSEDGNRRIPVGRGQDAKLQAEAIATMLSGGDMSWHKTAPAKQTRWAKYGPQGSEDSMDYRRGIMDGCAALLAGLVDSGVAPSYLLTRFYHRIAKFIPCDETVREAIELSVYDVRGTTIRKQPTRDDRTAEQEKRLGLQSPSGKAVDAFKQAVVGPMALGVITDHIDALNVYRYTADETDIGRID